MAFSGWLQSVLGWSARAQAASATPMADSDPGSAVVATTPPNDGIVYISDEINGEYFQGTGVLISPDEVLTASHVVYSTGEPVATNIEVAEGYGGGKYAPHVIDGTVTHYNAVDDANGEITLSQSQQDYAIIHLVTPLVGPTVFSLTSDYGDSLPNQTVLATTSGYPGSADGVQQAYSGNVSVDPYLTLYGGASLGPGSSGGPVWITAADGEPTVIGLVSSNDESDPDSTVSGNDVQITTAVLNQIETWVNQDDGTRPALSVLDTSNNDVTDPQAIAYTGPVPQLQDQYINVSPDNLNITANINNVFLHSGAGEDAIQALGGTNVLDGGTGSNFLVGGTGDDTFFTDDRAATSSIWDTVVGFHAGDSATVFGVTQAGFALNWANGEGAGGYTGLTLHATAAGKPEASVTLAGLTSAALTNGQLAITFGTTDGSAYMLIQDKG